MIPGRYHRKNKNKNWGRSLWSVKDSAEDQAHARPSLGPIPIKPLAEDFTPTLNYSLYRARFHVRI